MQFAARFSLVTWLCAAWPVIAAAGPLVVELWPGKIPDDIGNLGAEKFLMSPKLDHKQVEVTEPTKLVTNVSKPAITIYRPAKDKETGTAMLICPGGGYWNLYWQLEGEEVAAWLNSLGVTGIILKYRVPRQPDEPKSEPARRPLLDAQRAVSLVRSKAGQWGIDPKRIGIIGFSAGGHLALATATRFEKRSYPPTDAVDEASCRPDFAVLCYPGYLKVKDKEELAPWLHIPAGTPPVFLAHGGADIISSPEHSVVTYLALKRAGVPAELHIYATAAHDFGVRPSDHPCSTWTQACAAWLRHQGFLKPRAAELRVATFRCDVTPPLGYLTYPPTFQPLEKIEHPLLAKGIVLDDGGRRYVLCAIDWCGLCNSTYDLFRRKVAEGAGTDPTRVALHTVHQHTAPLADNDAYRLLLQTKNPPACPDLKFFEKTADRLGAAVKESLGRLQPFDRVGTGEGRVERVASTRRLIDKDGKVHHPRWSLVRGKDLFLRDEPEGLIDPLLKTITLAQGDKPLVRLHYYASHPQSYYHDPRVTYDFPGMAREALEEKENVFQVYFTGCAGDILVGKYNDGTPATRDKFAQRLLAGMEAASAATRFAPAESIRWRSTEVKLPLYAGPERTVDENRARMADAKVDADKRLELGAMFVAFADRIDRPLALSSLQIGRAHILDLPGECLVDYQFFAQRSAPGDFVAVAAYSDLGPGYICTDKAFEEGGYEPTDTGVGPGSEPLLKAAIVKLLGIKRRNKSCEQ